MKNQRFERKSFRNVSETSWESVKMRRPAQLGYHQLVETPADEPSSPNGLGKIQVPNQVLLVSGRVIELMNFPFMFAYTVFGTFWSGSLCHVFLKQITQAAHFTSTGFHIT